MKGKLPQRKKGMNPALASALMVRRENDLINATAKANIIITLMVLHDKNGFGKKRMERFLDEYRKQLEAYNSGYVEKVSDFENVLQEECGIRIEL